MAQEEENSYYENNVVISFRKELLYMTDGTQCESHLMVNKHNGNKWDVELQWLWGSVLYN